MVRQVEADGVTVVYGYRLAGAGADGPVFMSLLELSEYARTAELEHLDLQPHPWAH
jgi:hypothetical protein